MLSDSRLGAEISFNIIVVSVIAIVLLVVMILILSGKSQFFGRETSSCENMGGDCAPMDEPCPSGAAPIYGTSCAQEQNSKGPKCCVAAEI